jgi:hypothetical protein
MPNSLISEDSVEELSFPFPQAASTLLVHDQKLSTHLPALPPSPADSTMPSLHQPTHRNAEDTEVDRLTRVIERGAPGDRAIFSSTKTPEQRELAKRKSQYYSDAFAARETNTSARERVGRDSTVLAEVRTNVIVSSFRLFS